MPGSVGASRSSCTSLQCQLLARAVRLYSRANTAAAASQMPTLRAWPLPGRRLSFTDGTRSLALLHCIAGLRPTPAAPMSPL